MKLEQGDIIKVSFDPIKGHEQAGFRPAMVIQNDIVSSVLNSTTIVVPISTSKTKLPFEVYLDGRTKTTGKLLCRQVRAIDLTKRQFRYVEKAPMDIVEECVNYINALIEIPG